MFSNLTYPRNLTFSIFIIGLIFSSFWYIGNALTGLLLLALTVIGVRSISNRHVWQTYALSKLMLIYLVWLFIVALCSTIPTTSLLMLGALAAMPVSYLVLSNTPFIDSVWKTLQIVFFVIAVSFALWAIWQVVNKIGYGHAVGPLIDRNAFAALMNLFWFPIAFLFLSHLHIRGRWILVIGIGLFLVSVALFATTSRGGIAIWLLLSPFLLRMGYIHTKSKKIIAIISLLVLLAYVSSAYLLKSNFIDRNFHIGASTVAGQLSQDESVNARLLMWQSTWQMAAENPLVGTGWGTFVSYYPAYRSPLENTTSGISAHNDYLQMAAEGGFLTLLLQLGILAGILLQLKRSMKLTTSNAGFESYALLLGVTAIFIQASVNFIFVFAFINLIVGVYLARAARLIETPREFSIPELKQIRPAIKQLTAGFLVIIISIPYVFHLIAQVSLTGPQYGLKLVNLVSPQTNAYSFANFITTVYPQEYISQALMLQVAEKYLENQDANSTFKLQLLDDTIKRFEYVRMRSANNPNIGVREVQLLLKYSDIVGVTAYTQAQEILEQNLRLDPYHANSMIMLARLQVVQGHKDQALQTLQFAENHIRTQRDQQLVKVEILRQVAAPQIISRLNEIERTLSLVKSDSETGKSEFLPQDFYKKIDSELNVIAGNLKAN